MDKFVHEAKRAPAALTTTPASLERERKRIVSRLATWIRLAEQEPNSPTILAQLRDLEAERERVEKALQDAERNTHVKVWLSNLTAAESRKIIEGWCVRDHATIEERRAALAQMVERVEFDPATGQGRVHYRVGLNGARFKLGAAARELGLTEPGYKWRPHGDSNPGYRRERAITAIRFTAERR